MKKIKILALLAVVCVGTLGCQKSGDSFERQQALKQEGMELQTTGDYEGAIAKYEEALQCANMEVGPGEIDLAFYKASAQYRSGDLEGAIETLSAVLDFRQEVDAYLGRGMLYIEAKDAKKAEEDLNKALKETNDPLIKGIIYQVVDQKEKAKENFEKAKNQGNDEAIYYLAKVYEEEGDHNYAMILLEEYLAGGKAGAEGYLTVAQTYFAEGKYEEALGILQGGIALGESGALKNLMKEEIACYEKLGSFETAREKATAYLERYPDDAMIQKEYEFLKSR